MANFSKPTLSSILARNRRSHNRTIPTFRLSFEFSLSLDRFCNLQNEMVDSHRPQTINGDGMTAETDIFATLETYAQAYCEKDLDRLMALFDVGDDVSVIGTGADELCVGRDRIERLFRRNFAEATAEKFEWHWTKVTIRANAGVVATTLTIHLDIEGEKLQVPLRWTVSLRQKDGVWLWLHRHASLAAGGQDEGAAYPTK